MVLLLQVHQGVFKLKKIAKCRSLTIFNGRWRIALIKAEASKIKFEICDRDHNWSQVGELPF